MKELARILQIARVIFKREPWWAEFWSALTAISWAMLSYASISNAHGWRLTHVLTELGTDQVWYFCGFLLGVSQLAFLLYDQRWLRWTAAIMLCWFWGVLTLGIWAALPFAPASAVYAGWCGINVFSILRLLRPHVQ